MLDILRPEGYREGHPHIPTIEKAYGWMIGNNGELYGLVAGDMGYEATGIRFDLNDAELALVGLINFIEKERSKLPKKNHNEQENTNVIDKN